MLLTKKEKKEVFLITYTAKDFQLLILAISDILLVKTASLKAILE